MVQEFISSLNEIGIELNEKQIEQFDIYYRMLVEWNDKINLTAITEKKEVYQKHFLDSIYISKFVNLDNQTILDVGSGAGFPSIPLKIVYPEIEITIIDALKKRINFLDLLTKELGLEVDLIHGRAEEFKKKNQFDIVTARAVANLRMLSELCIPFARVDGYFMSLKGPKYEEELEVCKNAFDTLKVELDTVHTYTLVDDFRALILLKKTEETPDKYPRRFNKIKSKPL